MKTKKEKGNGKAVAVEKDAVEKDAFGFKKGSKSSEAVKLLASGKSTAKEIRKQFDTLSFSKLLQAVESHGFKVKEGSDGKCSVTGKLKA